MTVRKKMVIDYSYLAFFVQQKRCEAKIFDGLAFVCILFGFLLLCSFIKGSEPFKYIAECSISTFVYFGGLNYDRVHQPHIDNPHK